MKGIEITDEARRYVARTRLRRTLNRALNRVWRAIDSDPIAGCAIGWMIFSAIGFGVGSLLKAVFG